MFSVPGLPPCHCFSSTFSFTSPHLVIVVVEGDLVPLEQLVEVGGDVAHAELVPPLVLVARVLLVDLMGAMQAAVVIVHMRW